MKSEDGIRVGSLVFFDVAPRHALIGMVVEIDNSNPANRQVHIMHPSGRIRIRSLDYDLKKGGIVLVPSEDARALTPGCTAWKKAELQFDKRSLPERILDYVNEHEPCLQTDILKHFQKDYSKRYITVTCRKLFEDGKIFRRKSGGTYSVMIWR